MKTATGAPTCQVRFRVYIQNDVAGLRERTWNSKLACKSINADTLVLQAPNRFVAAYIATHFSELFAEVVQAEMGRDLHLSIKCPD